MSLKAYYPTRKEIQDAMKGEFDATWTESKQDPGKREYGYFIYLKDRKLEKGILSKGDPRDCSATEQHVTLVGSESPLMDNPTRDAYKGNQYVVAWFHTHPTRYGCGSSSGTRDPGPSTDDEKMRYLLEIPRCPLSFMIIQVLLTVIFQSTRVQKFIPMVLPGEFHILHLIKIYTKNNIMRPISIFSITVAILFFVVTSTYSQELAKIVKSPRALQLEAEMAQIRKSSDLLDVERSRLEVELRKLRDPNGTSDPSQAQIDLVRKIDTITIKRDSILNLIDKMRLAYSAEITQTKESQEVLRKMQEAEKAGDEWTAAKINKEYSDLLKRAAQEKFRLRQINLETMKMEVKAAYKIGEALSSLTFRPVKITFP